MKPTVTKLKSARGRIIGYRADLGQIVATGQTPREAREECVRRAMLVLSHPGVTLVLHDLHPDEHGIRKTWILNRYGAYWDYSYVGPSARSVQPQEPTEEEQSPR